MTDFIRGMLKAEVVRSKITPLTVGALCDGFEIQFWFLDYIAMPPSTGRTWPVM